MEEASILISDVWLSFGIDANWYEISVIAAIIAAIFVGTGVFFVIRRKR